MGIQISFNPTPDVTCHEETHEWYDDCEDRYITSVERWAEHPNWEHALHWYPANTGKPRVWSDANHWGSTRAWLVEWLRTNNIDYIES